MQAHLFPGVTQLQNECNKNTNALNYATRISIVLKCLRI